MSTSTFTKAQNGLRNPNAPADMPLGQVHVPSKAPAQYASVFWKCDYLHAKRSAEVTFGWCLLGGASGTGEPPRRGAWVLSRSLTPEFVFESAGAPLVEEAIGVFARALSRDERQFDHRIERLIADNLLLFAHSVLFAQRPKAPPDGWPPPDIGAVDTLLVIDPELHKYRGRICYTHFNRRKTVAIIGPALSRDMSPAEANDWEEHPYPPLSDDSAVRRWRVRRSAWQRKGLLGEFAIIVPTGDAVVGTPSEDSLNGGLLWTSKAETIKALLHHDWQPVRLKYWDECPVFLPLGMREAARCAALYGPGRKATETKQSIKDSDEAGSFSEFERTLQEVSSVAALREDVGDILLIRSWRKYRHERHLLRKARGPSQRSIFETTLAGEKMQEAETKVDVAEAAEQAIRELKEELGEDAIQ